MHSVDFGSVELSNSPVGIPAVLSIGSNWLNYLEEASCGGLDYCGKVIRLSLYNVFWNVLGSFKKVIKKTMGKVMVKAMCILHVGV